MRFLKGVLFIVAIAAIAIFALRLTFPLPDVPEGQASSAIPMSAETRLGAAIVPLMEQHPDKSGVVPLADGSEALAARILLARAAEVSIDVQYYIWQRDTTSWLLLEELRAAAERGVRVRLLLDDNGIPGLDNVLAGLNEMPNVEVRIFNPFTLRSPKLLSYVFDFFRLNRRMHNKSMTVDGVATIIGGRNIGDIYFAYGDGAAYFDLDVLAVGPAAADVSENFDDYWTSRSVYPADDVLSSSDEGLRELADAVSAARESALGSRYREAIRRSPIAERLSRGEGILEWVGVTLVSDDPSKGLGEAEQENLLAARLWTLVSPPKTNVDLVSAYLIPGEGGTARLEDFLGKGVRVRMLTNSLEATDVPLVHSGWMGYRDRLVRAGADVLELRARPEIPETTPLAQLLGGSLSSLHAKTFSLDDERIFIGSFNFDPRSVSLNTEMGFLIESPRIAQAMSAALDNLNTVYRVDATETGDIEWTAASSSGETIVYSTEPNTSAFQRLMVTAMSWLPFEWML